MNELNKYHQITSSNGLGLGNFSIDNFVHDLYTYIYIIEQIRVMLTRQVGSSGTNLGASLIITRSKLKALL